MCGRGSRVTPRRPAAVGSFPAPVRRVAAVRARDAVSAGLADAPPQPSDARGQGVRGSRGRARGGCNAVRQAARTRSSSAASAAPPVVSAPATRLPGLPGRPASHRRLLVHRDSRRDALHETCTCLSSLPSFASLPPCLRRVHARFARPLAATHRLCPLPACGVASPPHRGSRSGAAFAAAALSSAAALASAASTSAAALALCHRLAHHHRRRHAPWGLGRVGTACTVPQSHDSHRPTI